MSRSIEQFLVPAHTSVKHAMKLIDDNGERTLFIVDGNRRLLGSLSDGDIRRWILNDGSMDVQIGEICNATPFSVRDSFDVETIRQEAIRLRLESIPVLDDSGVVAKLLFREDIFGRGAHQRVRRPLGIEVVIMAGGKGTRLAPFTHILPKPLIPIGDKTIIEVIIDKFLAYDVTNFFITLQHKSKIIISYFEELAPTFSFEFVVEEKPSGTAGGLLLLREKVGNRFLLTNCDILIDADYAEIDDFHREHKNDVTLVASMKNYRIPYGICELGEGGILTRINEKPEYMYLVNTGMYIVNTDVLKYIPRNQVFNMTDLIECVRDNGGRVGVFPISEGSWLDTGEWQEYRKVMESLRV